MKNQKLYYLWQRIKGKCFNSNDLYYHLFGERGITVCEDWELNFLNFQEWCLANGYKEGMYFTRINPDGNFEPFNCKWVSNRPASRKSLKNEPFTINGETHTYKEWADIKNIPWPRILWRIAHKWDMKKALTTPNKAPGRSRVITFNGHTHTLGEWAQITGKSVNCLSFRLNYCGWNIEDTLTRPLSKVGRKKKVV